MKLYSLQMVRTRVQIVQPGYPVCVLSLDDIEHMLPHSDPVRATALIAGRGLILEHMVHDIGRVFVRHDRRRRKARVLWVCLAGLVLFGAVNFYAGHFLSGAIAVIVAGGLALVLKWRTG
jgi:hypothetical protein